MGEYDPFDDNAPQTLKGWLTAILELGAWLGTLLSGFIVEVLSRKYSVLVACGFFMLGVVIQAASITAGPQAILAGRFITWVNPPPSVSLIPEANRNGGLAVWESVAWPWSSPSTTARSRRPRCAAPSSPHSSLLSPLAS